MLDVLPTSGMELIHFVVGHGILRRELRSAHDTGGDDGGDDDDDDGDDGDDDGDDDGLL